MEQMMHPYLPEPKNGVHYLTPPKTAFEEVYIRLRTKEQRVHDDAFVRQLPLVHREHVKLSFEAEYRLLRTKEQRVHDDAFVRQLPLVPKTHPHAREWNMRRKTQERFCAFLATKNKPSVVDIGCGNGWFTARMAPFTSEIIGVDVGTEELEQAARCFGNELIKFVCCNDLELLPEAQFDCITFNASIQYFEPTEAF